MTPELYRAKDVELMDEFEVKREYATLKVMSDVRLTREQRKWRNERLKELEQRHAEIIAEIAATQGELL